MLQRECHPTGQFLNYRAFLHTGRGSHQHNHVLGTSMRHRSGPWHSALRVPPSVTWQARSTLIRNRWTAGAPTAEQAESPESRTQFPDHFGRIVLLEETCGCSGALDLHLLQVRQAPTSLVSGTTQIQSHTQAGQEPL